MALTFSICAKSLGLTAPGKTAEEKMMWLPISVHCFRTCHGLSHMLLHPSASRFGGLGTCGHLMRIPNRGLSALSLRLSASPARGAAYHIAGAGVGLRVFGSASSSKQGSSPKNGSKGAKLGDMIREYGPLALGVYAFFSSITFVCCLSSIYFLGVDRAMILDWIHRAKSLIGMQSKDTNNQDSDDTATGGKNSFVDFLPQFLKTDAVLTLGTNVLLAMVMTKLFMPVKFALVAGVTPMVARRLRSMGFSLGQKGGYKDAAAHVRESMKRDKTGH
ncbi:hypothetical protein BC830DRAFT_1101904 [Chytriomyces sp. MP71]|nr:hypothetical protein BC830DRAFT_1101904 [Chytriomyces sp. MP71]